VVHEDGTPLTGPHELSEGQLYELFENRQKLLYSFPSPPASDASDARSNFGIAVPVRRKRNTDEDQSINGSIVTADETPADQATAAQTPADAAAPAPANSDDQFTPEQYQEITSDAGRVRLVNSIFDTVCAT